MRYQTRVTLTVLGFECIETETSLDSNLYPLYMRFAEHTTIDIGSFRSYKIIYNSKIYFVETE
jgi:hypothetical protein